jgi:hypothetical protein
MRVLLDECVPRKLKVHLTGHDCQTAPEAGFAGKKNGELLKAAEEAGFHVFLTVDRGVEFQQNMKLRKIAVLLIRARSNRLADMLPLVPRILREIGSATPGQVTTLK